MFRLRKKPELGSDKPDTWPAVMVLEAKARKLATHLRSERNIDKMTEGESTVTSSILRDVKDRTSAIWYMRDQEQDARQAKKDAWVKKYRPIQTLDGLNPSRPRVEMRRIIKALEAFTIVMRTGI